MAVPALASADTGEIIEPQNNPPSNADGWQAGTCLTDEPVTGEPKVHCGPQTGGAFFKQAGGHPPVGFTQYTIQHEIPTPIGGGAFVAPIKEPEVNKTIKTLRVDLPPGLTVNPNATPVKCKLADFERVIPGVGIVPNCPSTSRVGTEEVTAVTNVNGIPLELNPIGEPGVKTPVPKGFVVPPTENVTKVAVYNLTPRVGEPALFGFVVAAKEEVFLETEVAWQSDFHESFRIKLPNSSGASEPGLTTLISRLINNGASTGDGTYINNPTTCFNPAEAAYEHLYSTWFRAESYGVPNVNFPFGSTTIESKVVETVGGVSKPVQQEGCDKVPFTPGLSVDAGTTAVDSPSPATVETTLKYLNGGESPVQESHLRKAVVTMPEGMGLNSSGSVGLGECTDAQFKKGQRTYTNECPANSKIGSVTIESPPLAKPLTGDIYVGTQKSSNPESGEEFRILVEAKEPEEGIAVRLVGNTAANKTTGQLTTTFNEKEVGELAGALPEGLPQVPFTSVKLKFDGPKLVLTSPSTCETQATGEMEPWSTPGKSVAVSSTIKLSADPAGGSCPTTLAARKFTPGYTAASDSTAAGKYSPFRVNITRRDGEQEIKAVNVTLPKGLIGRLAGIPYCGEGEIAAATASSGRAQLASPSCPGNSSVGKATTLSGTGNAPLSLPGTVYLAGPYKGAPLSLAVVTPAVSGPFDLGTVVVRVALNVNPLTAQVNAVSDPIPNVFGGVKLDIRSINLNMDRFQFMLNPTNCAAQATAGTINGGGSNPANAAAWSSYAISSPFQASGCKGLGFKPTFNARISGPTTRAKNPQIRVVVKARKGDANIARTALNLPHSLFLDQGHIKTVCTRVQLAAKQCPQNSIYGHAEASSPLLKQKLKGPVYLVSSKHKLPDLLVDLRGQINIQLDGVISSQHGGLKTVFNNTPDVPLKTFILNMQGGKKSLLQNSTNLCKTPQLAILNMKGQNGKTVKNNKLRLNIASCGGKKK
ncbi:MAG TPA: hypothetical protein VGH14_10845 [Solirubrobacterales bacterium]